MKPLHVGTSPLTGRIYAGTVAKDRATWASKQDVTGPACGAVIEHVLHSGKSVDVSVNGVPTYRITVEKIDATKVQS